MMLAIYTYFANPLKNTTIFLIQSMTTYDNAP